MPVTLLNRPILAFCILLNTVFTFAVLLIWLISTKPADVRRALAESEARSRAEVLMNRSTIASMELQWKANKDAIEALGRQNRELHADIRRLLVTLIEQAESK